MNNIHPLFAQAIKPFAPATTKPYAVAIKTAQGVERFNVAALTSADAVTMAVDMFYDGSQPIPCDGLMIEVRPCFPEAA